jgi:hypothetical protein
MRFIVIGLDYNGYPQVKAMSSYADALNWGHNYGWTKITVRTLDDLMR